MSGLYSITSNANVAVANTTSLYIGSGNISVLNSAQSLLNILSNTGTVGFALTNGNTQVLASVLASGVVAGAYGNASYYPTFTVGSDGRLTVANVIALSSVVSSYGNANVSAFLPTYTGNVGASNVISTNVYSSNYFYANGQPFASSTYSNANVAAFLPTFTGNVGAGNVVSTNVYSSNYFYANGQPFASSTYSNANVAAFLPTYAGELTANNITASGTLLVNDTNGTGSTFYGPVKVASIFGGPSTSITNGNIFVDYPTTNASLKSNVQITNRGITVIANVSAQPSNITITNGYFVGNGYYLTGITTGSTYGNANVAAYLASGTDTTINAINANVTAANSAITTFNANLGAYQTYANANAANQQTSITSINANVTAANAAIATLSANVGAYETWANAAIASTNANVTAANAAIAATNANLGAFETYANAAFGPSSPSSYANSNVGAYLASGTLTTNIITTANVSGNYILGNGSQLTGIVSTYGNANVAAYLPTYTGQMQANAYTAFKNNISSLAQTGAFAYGVLNYQDTYILSNYSTSVNSFAQVVIQNQSNGAAASGDFIVSNNLANATANYGDFGINSSGFSGTGSLNLPGVVYLYSQSTDLTLGTVGSNPIHFVVANGATDAMTIAANGRILAGNIITSGTTTVGNLITTAGVYWSNGAPYSSGSTGVTQIVAGTNVTISPVGGTGTVTVNANTQTGTYSNANVASYLASGTDAIINAINANITAANLSIDTLNANVGAFETYANVTFSTQANAASQQTSITSINANLTAANAAIATTNANLGAFETYANATFGTSSYSNVNAAAYLASGLISTNIVTTANVNANNITATSNVNATYMNAQTFYGNLIAANVFVANVGITAYTNYNSVGPPPYLAGAVWYDGTQDSLSYYNSITNNEVNVGQELQFNAYNGTGSQINQGVPVYLTGGQFNTTPNIAPAQANTISTSQIAGVANQNIPAGTLGSVVTVGVVANVAMGSFSVGDTLYLSPYSAGQVQNTQPPTGFVVKVGTVLYNNSPNGRFLVNKTVPVNNQYFGNLTLTGNLTANNASITNGLSAGNITTTSGVYWANGAAYSTSGATFTGNLAGNILYDSVNLRTFANAYPLSTPDASIPNNTYSGYVQQVPVYTANVLQQPPLANATTSGTSIVPTPSQVVGFVQTANVGLQSGYGFAGQNRNTIGTLLSLTVNPATANTMSNNDRVRSINAMLDVNPRGSTWGTMSSASQNATTLAAINGIVNINGAGAVSTAVGGAYGSFMTPGSGNIANVQYSTSIIAFQTFNTTGTTPGTGQANVVYGRMISPSFTGFSANAVMQNAVGLHTYSGWAGANVTVGSTNSAWRAYAVLNEDAQTTIQTVGNVVLIGSSTLLLNSASSSINAVAGNTKLGPYQEAVGTFPGTAGTITVNVAITTIKNYTLTGNITINTNNIVGAQAGSSFTLILQQDATGNRTLTSNILFSGGSKTLSTAPNAQDVLAVFTPDGTTYYGSLVKGYI